MGFDAEFDDDPSPKPAAKGIVFKIPFLFLTPLLLIGSVPTILGLLNAPAHYLIVNRDTGFCLDVPYGLLDEGTKIEQCGVNGGGNQMWRLDPVAGDGVRIVNRHTDRCLDIPYGKPDPHLAVEQCSINGGGNQGWRLESTGDGWYRIVNQYTGLCLEVPAGSREVRTVIEQAPDDGGKNQHWRTVAVK